MAKKGIGWAIYAAGAALPCAWMRFLGIEIAKRLACGCSEFDNVCAVSLRPVLYPILLPRRRHCGCIPQSLRWRVLDPRTGEAQAAMIRFLAVAVIAVSCPTCLGFTF
jgi:hypothetical protein